MPTGAESAIRDSRWAQWAPVSGIVFCVLFAIGIVLFEQPDVDNPAARILSFYDDEGNRTQNIISGYLLVLSGLFFLWFLGSLRTRLLEAEGPGARLTSIAFASGTVFTALLLTAAGCFMFVSAEITFADVGVEAAVARVLPDLGFVLLLLPGMFAAIAMIDATSILIIRTGVMPAWVGWLGFVAAFGLLFSFLVFPAALLLVWVGIVSLALLSLNGVNVPGMAGSARAPARPVASPPGAPGP